jgi:hypothetical protein
MEIMAGRSSKFFAAGEPPASHVTFFSRGYPEKAKK